VIGPIYSLSLSQTKKKRQMKREILNKNDQMVLQALCLTRVLFLAKRRLHDSLLLDKKVNLFSIGWL